MTCRMASFISDLLGAPWEQYTCGPDKFDCFGLCVYMTRELTGIEIPHPMIRGSVKDIHTKFRKLEDGEMLCPMDWVYLKESEGLHIGIIENRTFYVEATQEFGVMRRRIETLHNPEFYRLRDVEANSNY